MTGSRREVLIRILNRDLEREPCHPGRGHTCGADVDDALSVIRGTRDSIRAERLTLSPVWMAQHLARPGEMTVSEPLLAHLAQTSILTAKRRLVLLPRDRLHQVRTEPGQERALLHDIPTLPPDWDTPLPRDVEIDPSIVVVTLRAVITSAAHSESMSPPAVPNAGP